MMKSNSSKSRFSAVPPSTAGPSKVANAYFASARQKSEKLRNYFDDDEDDDQSPVASYSANIPAPDDDYDPLDAFM